MTGKPRIIVRSHRVAAELRRLRESAGLSCQDVAERLGMSVSKVSRLETGSSGLRLADVEALLGLYAVPADRGAELLAVARQCLGRIWWGVPADRSRHRRAAYHLEAAAHAVRDFQRYLLPVPLRTPDFHRLLLRDGFPTRSAEEIEAQVAVGRARQAALFRPDGPRVDVIVDEYAVTPLRDRSAVSRVQLAYLRALAARPNVTFRVVPNSVGTHAGLNGSVTLLEFAGEVSVAYVEQLDTATYVRTPSDLLAHRRTMSALDRVALSPADTTDFLRGLARA